MGMALLLLQARYPGDPAKEEERASFAARLGVPRDAIVSHDLLQGPPTLDQVRAYTALLIGGAGDFDVTKRNLPYFEDTLELLRQVVAEGHPMFASCFGFQMLVDALGGRIVRDEAHMEVGTYRIYLTDAAREDELFRILPPTFMAQEGHKERAEVLPPGVIHLAYSDRVPYQAFRVPGKPIWATQFHPELTGAENRRRFEQYVRVYGKYMSEEELQERLRMFQPSPETERLLPRFLELITAK